MAISFARPDPTSAASVSSAQFNTSRKGFDHDEVRDFLRMVAAELARLQERERHLERELKAAQETPKSTLAKMDEEVATRLLGEEAAHILGAAREAASQIRTRAEEGSGRLLREATEESKRVREEADIEAARRRQDAANDAEAEVNMAKQQGRDMVNEARAYREKVLSELARRRETARQQLEQLVQGRDRLVQAFERSRLAAVDVMADLAPLDTPEEFIDLAPITGPIPIMLRSEALPTSVSAAVRTRAPAPVPTAPAAPLTAVGAVAVETDLETGVPASFAVFDEVPAIEVQEDAHSMAQIAADIFGASAPAATVRKAAPEAPATSVDDLFAKLRASSAESIVLKVNETPRVDSSAPTGLAVEPDADATDATVADSDESADGASDTENESVTPLIVSAARKLKRVLADEQNDVLDLLRRKDPVLTLEGLVASPSDHARRYVDAVQADLVAAGLAGAQGGSNGGEEAIVRPACDAIGELIVSPLRERIARCIENADSNASDLATSMRSVYREWKLNRIDEHLDEIVRLAYERGALTLTSR